MNGSFLRPLRLAAGALLLASPAAAQAPAALHDELDRRAMTVNDKVVGWRRHVHQHPELSNREFETSKLVAAHLRALGIDVQTGVARTGVVGVLRGGRPGRVVALRADMDALPVTEEVDLPFASKARGEYNGQDVGVMHACGHDAHVAMLMGAAEILAAVRDQLPGTVKFIFQPAEEGAPPGERGGASVMVEEGVLQNPSVDAIFALHVYPFTLGTLHYRPGAVKASSDAFRVVVRGRQSHGALPWRGIDPIVVASQIVLGLQTIVSRQVDLTATPAVITVGSFQGGVRYNIVPDSVVLNGTIRTFSDSIRGDIIERARRTVEQIAASAGATASLTISNSNPVTYNDPALVARMQPTLERVAGAAGTVLTPALTTAEDFAFYQKQVPGIQYFLGITPPGSAPVPNHSPRFVLDEAALPVGVRAFAHLAVDYLHGAR